MNCYTGRSPYLRRPMDFPLILDRESQEPLHRQLTAAMKEAITSGRLCAGQGLPSSRELASALGVSRDTVVRSYQDLTSQGYISLVPNCGTFVSVKPLTSDSKLKTSGLMEASEAELLSQATSAGLSDFARRLLSSSYAGATAADLPNLNYGAAPRDALPFKIWRQLLSQRSSINKSDSEFLDFDANEIFGYEPLREQVCRFLNRAKGLHCDPSQVVVFTDSQSGLDLIARVLINPGDLVVLENPGYSGARELFQAYGAEISYVPVDENGLNTALLPVPAQPCKLIYVSPSHQDPTGAVLTLSRRKELLAWAEKHCRFIVEDAFDSDYNYSANSLPALQAMTGSTPVLYLYSFWKLLFPLVSTGCLVLPEPLVSAFGRAKRYVDRNFSLTEHQALSDFLAEGHLERHIYKTRQLYRRRRQALIFALKQILGAAVRIPRESGGLHLSLHLSLPCSQEQVLDSARRVGLMLVSASPYYAGGGPEEEYLVDFAGLPEEQSLAVVSAFAGNLELL